MQYKTWEEFWGEFLQVRFHSENPELWPFRQKKALWFLSHCNLKPGARILDLGCGDGLIDIWLSRMGFKVTAVDRNKKVLDVARSLDDTKKVNFIHFDLRSVQFDKEAFDAVLFIEALGLMSKADDASLISKSHQWLSPRGQLIIDCPEQVEEGNSWSKEFPEGIVSGVSSFNPNTRLQDIQFFFQPHGEKYGQEKFGIFDPYDLTRGKSPGITRYIYPKSELIKTMTTSGYDVSDTDHYYPKNYYGLKGIKR